MERVCAAETGCGMTLGDTARLKCGDVAVDGEVMSRGTRDVSEDGKVEDGTPLRIVQTLCDTTKSGPEIRLQMLEISLVSHLVA